jgi:hypothetical protein
MKSIRFFFLVLSAATNISNAQVTAAVYGDAVTIRDANFDWACGGRFYPEIQIVGDTITVMEVDTMNVTTCSCPFTVITLVGGLNAGTYTAKVFRQHRLHMRYPVDTMWIVTQYAGAVSFTIAPHPSAPPEIALHQINCGVNPGAVETQQPAIPGRATLSCFPNPFNPGTTLQYSLPVSGKVTLAVYDMTGKCVEIVADDWKEAGRYEYSFERTALSSGLYVCRMNYGGNTLSVKLLLLK